MNAKKKEALTLVKAIGLRSMYDEQIVLLNELLGRSAPEENDRYGRYDERKQEDRSECSDTFDEEALEKEVKKLKIRRAKLNQAIQVANFKISIQVDGESYCLAEALELRKQLKADIFVHSRRTKESAKKRILTKEKRDVVVLPRHVFADCYKEYCETQERLRLLMAQIHNANANMEVNFRME